MKRKCVKFIFLIACCAAFCQYAVAQPRERNNVGDDHDLEPWPDEEEEASALAPKPNGGSSSAGGDDAAAASQGAGDGPRAEDGVKFSLPSGHVPVITWEAPASQNQAEGFPGAPDGISPVADCSQAAVCPTGASATGQNSNESDADPLQQNTAALAHTVDQSVETDKALASDSGTPGTTGVEPAVDEDQDVRTGQASAVPEVLGPQTPHLQEPGDGAVACAEAGATTLKEGPGWQAEASFDFPTSGDCSESSASEDAFQPGLGHYDEKDCTKLALQSHLGNGTSRRAQSDDAGDGEGDGHDHTLIKGADTSSSPAPAQNHGAGFELTPFVSEQPEPAEEEDGQSSGHFMDLAPHTKLRENFAQLSLVNTAETEGSDEESSDSGALLPVQESEEGQEGTSSLSFPSTWSPAVIVQDRVQSSQQAESDHHADTVLRSPDTVQGSLASSQDVDLHGNQDFARPEEENDTSSSDAASQGSTAYQVPAQSTANRTGHVDGNFHCDRQAETDLDIPLHYNDPTHVSYAIQDYIVFCLNTVLWAFVILLLWYRRSG